MKARLPYSTTPTSAQVAHLAIFRPLGIDIDDFHRRARQGLTKVGRVSQEPPKTPISYRFSTAPLRRRRFEEHADATRRFGHEITGGVMMMLPTATSIISRLMAASAFFGFMQLVAHYPCRRRRNFCSRCTSPSRQLIPFRVIGTHAMPMIEVGLDMTMSMAPRRFR